MNRMFSQFFKLATVLFVTSVTLSTLGVAQTCFQYKLTVQGKVLDESNQPLPNVTIFDSSSGSVYSQTNTDGSWSISRDLCLLSPPRCIPLPVGASYHLYLNGWTFSPSSITVCESGTQTVNVTARRNSFTAVSAANYQPILARGAIHSLFANTSGVSLATGTQAANQIPLPETLANTTLNVSTLTSASTARTQLFFVSPSQVNFYLPPEIQTTSEAVNLVLKNGNGNTYTATAIVRRLAPAYFSANASGQGPASGVVVRVRNGVLTYEDLVRFDKTLNRFVNIPVDLGPTTDQVFLALFGTGFRAHAGLDKVSVKVGGLDSQVTYAGEQPSFTGVDQTNILLPRTLAGRGEVDVALTVEGLAANLVKVAIK